MLYKEVVVDWQDDACFIRDQHTKKGGGGSSWPWSYGSWIYNYLCNRCLSPLMLWVRIPLKAWCTTICQCLLQVGGFLRVFRVSSTNKTDRHDIAEILLKVTLNSMKPNQTKLCFYAIQGSRERWRWCLLCHGSREEASKKLEEGLTLKFKQFRTETNEKID